MYFITFILTCLGMLCRYILEYGEVSNTINFTIKNILLTLIFMPILVIIITLLIEKIIKSKKKLKNMKKVRYFYMKITSIVFSSIALLISGCALALSIISLVNKRR